jgi:integrase
VNETTLGRYQAQLRQDGRAETTIKGHLAHILAALNWAKSKKLIYEVPDVKMPKRARKSKVMKGRPITTEEFERMLNSVVGVVTPKDAHIKAGRKPAIVASWRYVLRGLWLSGLRLNESMHVHWTDRSMLCVESLDARHPMLWIPSDLEKGNQDRVLPIAPEFAEFLRQTPPEGRQGYVFNPLPRRNRYSERLASHHVGRVLCAVGEAANVKVSETDGKVKFASAHDLRRSFGERWAPRVMPNVLQELMRHENIQTTMRYYVGENAKRTAAILWEAYNSSSDPQAMKSQTSPTESYLPSIL